MAGAAAVADIGVLVLHSSLAAHTDQRRVVDPYYVHHAASGNYIDTEESPVEHASPFF